MCMYVSQDFSFFKSFFFLICLFVFLKTERKKAWSWIGGKVGQIRGGDEGGETIFRIYCMKTLFLMNKYIIRKEKSNKFSNPIFLPGRLEKNKSKPREIIKITDKNKYK